MLKHDENDDLINIVLLTTKTFHNSAVFLSGTILCLIAWLDRGPVLCIGTSWVLFSVKQCVMCYVISYVFCVML